MFEVSCAKSDGEIENGGRKNTKYFITLNLNGGTLEYGGNIIEFSEGETVVLPVPKRDDYDFAGWYDNADFTGARYIALDGKYAYSDREFWAEWVKYEKNPENNSEEKPEVKIYKIKYVLNEGFFDGQAKESYTAGERIILPTPVRLEYNFAGWYEDENFSGKAVAEISENSYGDKTFYAKWEKIPQDPVPQSYKITFMLDGGVFENGYPTEYKEGERISLPVPVRKNCVFDGWFEDENFDGRAVEEITAEARGDKIFYAKWREILPEPSFKIGNFGGYEEGAFVEIPLIENTGISDYTFEYKDKSNYSDWEKVDSELIRIINNNTVRADILGLKSQNYDIRVNVAGESAILSDITVKSYDKSGYAHFKRANKGVGAYNPDGTVKNGAQIIYVTEETKNTVEATIGGSSFKGIANILSHAGNLNGSPLIVRIIGQVAAATWNYLEYNAENFYGGRRLSGLLSQSELIKQRFNSLDITEYSELDGLTSKLVDGGGKFDSFWNMCEIEAADNITIEGVGTDARLYQWGLSFIDCNSIEVRNLTFADYPEEACSFKGSKYELSSENIWVHNNVFLRGTNNWNVSSDVNKSYGDGAADFTDVSYVTVANNKFEGTVLTESVESSADWALNFTFHHNLYKNCTYALSVAGKSEIHLYNNCFLAENKNLSGFLDLNSEAYAFIENCYAAGYSNLIKAVGSAVKIWNSIFENCGAVEGNGIFIAETRGAPVKFGNLKTDFELSGKNFYFDGDTGVSSVEVMNDPAEIPEYLQNTAGAHKNNLNS